MVVGIRFPFPWHIDAHFQLVFKGSCYSPGATRLLALRRNICNISVWVSFGMPFWFCSGRGLFDWDQRSIAALCVILVNCAGYVDWD